MPELRGYIIVLLLGLLSFSCSSTQTMEMPNFSYVYKNKILETSQQVRLKELFSELPQTLHTFETKPDAELIGYDKSTCTIAVYSIYLKDKIVFNGHYLEAWTERMMGNASICYKLTSKAKNFLIDLENKTKHFHHYNIKFTKNIDKTKTIQEFNSKGLKLQFLYGEILHPSLKFSLITKVPLPSDYKKRMSKVDQQDEQLGYNNLTNVIKIIRQKWAVKKVIISQPMRTTGAGFNEINIEATVNLESASDIAAAVSLIRDSKGKIISVEHANYSFAQLKSKADSLTDVKKNILFSFPYVLDVERFVAPFPMLSE